jgi:septal ring factor EnvC (AmiA/AmiB activator)
VPSETPDAEILRQAWEVRSRDLVEARVGLAQAVAALTEELATRRREAEAAQAEIAALREHVARDGAAMRERHRATRELEAQLERARADLETLRERRALRYAAVARRLAGGLRARRR